MKGGVGGGEGHADEPFLYQLDRGDDILDYFHVAFTFQARRNCLP